MKIKDVQIDGFGVWSGLSVHSMPDTMTVFYGPNEAGKTTLMQFFRTMFYGFTPDRRSRYLPPVYGGKPGGVIRVTGPGGGYEISRRAQLDHESAAGQLTVTGSDGLTQGQHRLAMLLGQVDETIFTNVFAIGLRELQELNTLDDTAAADELYKLSSGLDRVSLVDVTRQLRNARQQIAGPTLEDGQLQQLMVRREKLKDEIDSLTGYARRWNELAALRATQNSELDELKQRIASWDVESKTYEVAIQVRPNWLKRAEVEVQIRDLNARTDIPEAAAVKLTELNEQISEREEKLGELRQQRKQLRETASKLPLRNGILELASKIEAAVEQAPWISAIQKNIQRLENQLQQTRQQLLEDAQRLGISEEDQQSLLNDRRMSKMPELSRQAIAQLAEPAGQVKLYSNRLKLAKQQSDSEKKEVARLTEELSSSMRQYGYDDIHTGMQENAELISLLRKRNQIQEVLDKQIRRREELESEAVGLAADEALPVERALMMGVLFVGGGFSLMWGLGSIFGTSLFTGAPQNDNSPQGFMLLLLGVVLLFFTTVWNSILDRGTVTDLEDVEDQIDAIRKEIRKTELERDDFERRLPAYNGVTENRLRDAETEVAKLEGLLPLQHNLEAATQRYRSARKQASQAAESLRNARSQWRKMLVHMGLTESLSPKSIRIMAEGYESLMQTRRRITNLQEELETRQLELGNLTQRIESLNRQAQAAKKASEVLSNRDEEDLDAIATDVLRHQSNEYRNLETTYRSDKNTISPTEFAPVKAGVEQATTALRLLDQMQELIRSQEQFIQQKRSLRDQDQHLAKQAAAIQKSMDKLTRSHSAVLAEQRCETESQLREQLQLKHQHEDLVKKQAEYQERITSMVGGMVPYETIVRLLDGPDSENLERRWEAIGQRTLQAEQRVEQLHGRQGELAQEMKTLAANGRLSEARLELTCVENQIKACAAHWQTLAVTTNLLDKVCEVYETERQPETLREASAFLNQLTEGKYSRIWTPLGKNQLRIDNSRGQSLPLEVLSRGTREAVFIALRLSLAAAYARRGVMIPLVLDDVLVNFDSIRAESAARVLRDFASLGHQVVMFTCHEHIMRIFYNIGVQVRVLPKQGLQGEADVYVPELPPPMPLPSPPPVVETVLVNDAEEEWTEEIDEPADDLVEIVAQEEPLQSLPVIELPRRTARPQTRRVLVVDNKPEIDWLWYEKGVSIPDSSWVEAEDQVDEKLPPPDLWWSSSKPISID